MVVLLIGNPQKDRELAVTQRAIDVLRGCGVTAVVCCETARALRAQNVPCPPVAAVNDADLVVTVGGDGTLLRAGAVCVAHQVPVLGVNLGRTGFLATCEVSELQDKLPRLAAGNYHTTPRSLLHVSVPEQGWEQLAVNDVVVYGSVRTHPMDYHLYCDGTFVSRYRSDGLIAATPTGSTAYSFSAGGPVLDADAPVMVLTPLCAHSLHAVPLVFSDQRTLEIRPDSQNRDAVQVCADSNMPCVLAPGQTVHLCRAAQQLLLVTFAPTEQIQAIETKLMRR